MNCAAIYAWVVIRVNADYTNDTYGFRPSTQRTETMCRIIKLTLLLSSILTDVLVQAQSKLYRGQLIALSMLPKVHGCHKESISILH